MKLTFWNFIRTKAPLMGYPYKGETIDCPGCGGHGERIARVDRYWKFLPTDICTTCGLFFTNPMPTDDELEEYYRVMYRSTYGWAFKSVPKAHAEKKKKDAARRSGVVASLFENPRGLRSLDFGCGLGELVAALERAGFDAYGFEPGDVWSQHLSSERIRHGTWQSVQYDAEAFDFVSIMHVLEHLRSPRSCLQKIHGLLKQDGLLWIEVPDMQAYGTKSGKRFHFAHVLGFSRDNLISMAFECGFVPVREVTKEEIGKSRSQVSIVFRKANPEDVLPVDVSATARKNMKEYGEFSHARHAMRTIGTRLGSRGRPETLRD